MKILVWESKDLLICPVKRSLFVACERRYHHLMGLQKTLWCACCRHHLFSTRHRGRNEENMMLKKRGCMYGKLFWDHAAWETDSASVYLGTPISFISLFCDSSWGFWLPAATWYCWRCWAKTAERNRGSGEELVEPAHHGLAYNLKISMCQSLLNE